MTYSLFQIQVPKDGGKTMAYKMVHYPTGYGVLPYEGGWLDQPHRLIQFFEIFMDAERTETARGLS